MEVAYYIKVDMIHRVTGIRMHETQVRYLVDRYHSLNLYPQQIDTYILLAKVPSIGSATISDTKTIPITRRLRPLSILAQQSAHRPYDAPVAELEVQA